MAAGVFALLKLVVEAGQSVALATLGKVPEPIPRPVKQQTLEATLPITWSIRPRPDLAPREAGRSDAGAQPVEQPVARCPGVGRLVVRMTQAECGPCLVVARSLPFSVRPFAFIVPIPHSVFPIFFHRKLNP